MLAGPRTGLALPACYAARLADCSASMSAEHYVSKKLLLEIGSAPLLSGLSFLDGRERRLPPSALTTRVLCGRHNTMLSGLDAEALKVFRASRRFEDDLKDSVAAPVDDVELVDGPRFEAWMVKTFAGLLAKGLMRASDVPITRWREGAEDVLLEVLFGGGSWPTGWGLWVIPPGRPTAAAADLALGPLTVDGWLWAGNVEFGSIVFQLALGRPGSPDAVHRPSALVLSKSGVDVEKTLAFGWPDGASGPPVTALRVGQMDGWDRSREPSHAPEGVESY